ncbi:MAG: hypothetical protein KIT77_16220, partial [Caldilinea sp.]|nr:hypothetical protein [Caldilinea sp.]
MKEVLITFVSLRLHMRSFPDRATQGTRRLCSVLVLGENSSRWRRDRMPGSAGLARQSGQGKAPVGVSISHDLALP